MEMRGSRSRPPARPAQPQQQAYPVQPPPAELPPRRPNRAWVLVGVGLIFGLIVLGIVAWQVSRSSAMPPRSDRYQVVFLDTGQAFFGTLKNTSGEYLLVENAYRAQGQDVPEDASVEQKQSSLNNVSLVKVGKEVYGPENAVRIRAEQVLFWQNLEPGSKVSKAIEADD